MSQSFVTRVIPDAITPNMLSWLRIGLIPIIWILYPESPLVAFLVYVVASTTDWIDGRLARERGLLTSVGKRLDEIADKLLVISVLSMLFKSEVIAFSVYSPTVWAVALIVARDLVITIMRFVWSERAAKVPSIFLAKVKTFALMLSLGFWLYSGGGYLFSVYANGLGQFLVWIAFGCALVSGAQYSYLFFFRK